jgi:hypothetical protein
MVLWLPQPMKPTVIRLLGAVAPHTDAGTRRGAPAAAERADAVLRKARRVNDARTPVLGTSFMDGMDSIALA